MKKALTATVLCLSLTAIGCGDDKQSATSEPAVNEQIEKPEPKASPVKEKTNHGTASFLGRTLSDMKVISAMKLSKHSMFIMKEGRITVMLNVPKLAKGTYETSEPGKGIALTLSGAGEPGTISIRPMKSAKIEIQEDGDIIQGSYSGLVGGQNEKPVKLSGNFRFERKMLP